MLNANDRIRDALGFIPASDRDTWLRMGMAVKSELDDAGFDLWDAWSEQGETYQAADARDVWKSIKASGKITIASLFHEAIRHGWQDDGTYQKPPPEELAERQRQNAERAAQDEAEKTRERADTAKKAAAILKAATGATADNPYLSRKDVSPVPTLREIDTGAAAAILGYAPKSGGEPLTGRLLVVPVKQGDGISTLELIDGDKRKAALAGRGSKVGGYWATERLPGGDGDGLTLLIGEGVATVLSAKEASGLPAIAALSSGNLPAVAKIMRERYPAATLVILADLVKATGEPDPHAIEAAKVGAGKTAIPNFGTDRDPEMKDMNDLAQLHGADAVAQAIAVASAPGKAAHQAEPLRAGERMAPEPLRAMLPPAEGFPVQSLGTVLGGAATALHESVKAPLALCCQSVLAAASFAVQAHANIKMPWGEVKPSTLFFLTVGESGERKSAIDDLVLGAAKAQERADMAIYTEKHKLYEVAAAAHKHAVDAARKAATTGKKGTATQAEVMAAVERCGEEPSAPVAPLRFVTDPTVEGLFKLMVVSQPSVALFSDEGGLLIGGHALNSDNALKTFARWCKLWDGSPFDRVRAVDGAGILYGRRMALHQLAQPDVMVKLLSDRMANGQGLLARCLVAWPATTIGTRHMERFAWAGDLPAMKRLYAVFKGLMEATPATGDESGQELTPFELELSPDAKALAVAASNQFETLMASGADLCELRDRTSKAPENACRIAGILAVIEGGLSVRVIESEYLQRALVLMQWYLAEALRIRGAAAVPQSVGDAETLSAWLRDRGLKMFRTKQVLHAGPSQLRNKPRLLSAINELVTAGYLIENGPGMVVDGVSARKSWEVIHHVV
jgi:putative DNA primase/helicase